MAKGDDRRDRVTKRMRWIARIWGIPLMVYGLLGLIGYAYSWMTLDAADPYAVEGFSTQEALPPTLMFLSILGLGIAWRWERLGGAIAIVFQLVALSLLATHSPITRDFSGSAALYLVSITIATPGALFLVCWWRSRKRAIPNDSA